MFEISRPANCMRSSKYPSAGDARSLNAAVIESNAKTAASSLRPCSSNRYCSLSKCVRYCSDHSRCPKALGGELYTLALSLPITP